MREAQELRAWLDRDPHNCIIGGVGIRGETLLAVLDRFDELEWIVGVMRGKVKVDAPQDTSPS